MNLKKSFYSLLVFFFVCLAWQAKSQEIKEYNKALIWRGFEHSWTYNHRINRLGDFVSYKEGIGTTTHSSATGVGSDSTFATTHYTYIESPDIFFKEAEISIFITGNEGDLLTQKEQIYLDLEDFMLNKDNYNVVLNGFEIKSVTNADQIHLFKFLVEDPVYNEQTQQLLITGLFNLVTNCRTLECSMFKNNTAYELTLKLLVFAYDNDDARFNNAISSKNYVWDTSIEVEDKSEEVNVFGSPDKYSKSCIGIRGMSYILDEEHWLLELKGFVTPKKYEPETGVLTSYMNMKFVEWKSEMNRFSVAPFYSKFSQRKNGYALLEMNLNQIQLANANIIHGSQSTSSYWKGRNNSADSNGAYNTIDITSKLKFKMTVR